eukprot:CAMPEP_0198441350 /NCGR_PEP_ID=MMETSP1452-20131203/62357_1 /TAXON_ID=1181717 /ORGANISM="Synchroma pusillum, Strain CCMP3072" /LENGTH=216 /DNA_ID=CAMNT_0044161975 /DNA_START=1 /DNA_END=648 /DNA_ORIENTATION=-
MCSILRSVWFFIPSSVLEPTYSPSPGNEKWGGVACSELLLTLGSLMLYAIFVLLVTFWSSTLSKVNKESSTSQRPMRRFAEVMAVLAAIALVNPLLYVCRVYGAQSVVLYDATFLSAVSLVTFAQVSVYSHRFRTALQTIGAINSYSTDDQARRILMTTIAANCFFTVRVALEVAIGISLIYLFRRNRSSGEDGHPLAIPGTYWDVYILLKHWSEV